MADDEAIPVAPSDRQARLASLHASGLLGTPPEAAFDRVTRLAQQLLGAPVTLVSLVDAHRLFFKSALGLPEPLATRREMPLPPSFCQQVADTNVPLIIENARAIPQLADHPVVHDLGIVAYAGVPFAAPCGQPLGALCAIDVRPRLWLGRDVEILRDLAAVLGTELAMRHALAERDATIRALQASEARYRAIVEDESDLICRFLPDTTLTFVNSAYCRWFGKPPGELVGRRFVELIPEADRARIGAMIAALEPDRPCTHEHEVLMPDGSVGWQQWVNRAIAGPDGSVVEYQAVGRDVTERKRREERLRRDAYHDPLTGLPNRRGFAERLAAAMHGAATDSDRLAVMMLDLDGFKEVNDRHGHPAGDAVLQAVAQRLQAELRAGDMVARLGGDELVVLLRCPACRDAVAGIAERMAAAVRQPIRFQAQLLQVGVCIGVAFCPEDAASPEALLDRADQALYAAKRRRQPSPAFYAALGCAA